MKTPPWLNEAMENPATTDICLNGDSEVYIDQGKGFEKLKGKLWDSPQELKTWVLTCLSEAKRAWDAKHPFVDATLRSGHRMHVAFPPISQKGILVSLRRRANPVSDIQRWDSKDFQILSEIYRKGESILLSGATGSGKTTLASDLLGHLDPKLRLIALEDTPELNPNHPHFLSLVSRPPNSDGVGEVTLQELMRQALRMKPDRIILGECRGREVLELLQALNTGHEGALATIHANHPRDAIKRVVLLSLLHPNTSLSPSLVEELISNGLKWIVQLKKRKIQSIWRLEGMEKNTILMRPVIDRER